LLTWFDSIGVVCGEQSYDEEHGKNAGRAEPLMAKQRINLPLYFPRLTIYVMLY
jgi:hypothetical protein